MTDPSTFDRAIATPHTPGTETLIRALPAMVWQTDATGRIEYVNDAWRAFRGRSLHDEQGEGWLEGVHPQDRERRLIAGLEHLHRRESFEIEYRLLRHDGVYRPVIDHGAPWHRSDRAFGGFVGACMDIGDRVVLHERAQRSADGYLALIERMPQLVIVHSRDKITFVNPATLRALGYATASDLLGRAVRSIIFPEDLEIAQARIDFSIESGRAPSPLTMRFVARDGRPVWVESTGQMLSFAGETHVVTVATDVSERVRAEEDVRTLATRLSEAEEAERRRIAHDLHDSVGQMLAAARRQLESLTGQLSGSAESSVRTSREWIEQVIAEVRTLTFDLHPTMLDDLGLAPTLERFAEQFTARNGLRVTVTESGTPTREARTVLSYLFRSAKELLTNVAKHAKATEVVVGLHWDPDHVRLAIDDDGCGFDVADARAPGNRRGLGLASIHERVRTLGGTFEIEARPGQGTRVVVELPRSVPAEREP